MFYGCPDKLCYARVVLISQEQFEEAVSGVAAVLRRAWVEAPEDRVRAWAREAVYAAEAVLLPPGSVSEERDAPRERGMPGQDVGVDPRLERHQAERREYQITERDVLGDFARGGRPPLPLRVVGGGQLASAEPQASGVLYLTDGEHVYAVEGREIG